MLLAAGLAAVVLLALARSGAPATSSAPASGVSGTQTTEEPPPAAAPTLEMAMLAAIYNPVIEYSQQRDKEMSEFMHGTETGQAVDDLANRAKQKAEEAKRAVEQDIENKAKLADSTVAGFIRGIDF